MASNFSSGPIRIQGRSVPLAAAAGALDAAKAALGRGDLDAAMAIAGQAVRAGLEHPLLLNLYAAALERTGELDEAAVRLRRAVELAPDDPRVRNALGLTLEALGRPDQALMEFDAAVRLDPGFAAAHCNRGAALEAMGELTTAEAGYRQALELAPGHVGALSGLASLASRFGEHLEAQGLARRVLDAEAAYPPAVMALAAAETALDEPATAEARLRALLDDARPSPLQKAHARVGLGDALDAQDRPAEAFAAYVEAGAEARRLSARRFAGRPGARETAEALAAWLEQTPPPRWPAANPAASPPPTHVFLLGFARSATTLLEQVLAGHPEVRTIGEQETLADASAEFLGGPDGLDRLMAADEARLQACREAYWRRVRAAGADPSGAVFVDKHPFNSLRLPLIARLFPQAKILFALRDPRDVVLSCLRRRFNINPLTYELLTLEGCARLYAAAMRITTRTQELAGLELCSVRHEEITADFESEIARVCAFLGIEPSADMGDFGARVRARGVNTPSAAQLAGGLDPTAVGQWRRYAAELEPVRPILEPWIERFGYGEIQGV